MEEIIAGCQWTALPTPIWVKIFMAMSNECDYADHKALLKVFPTYYRHKPTAVTRCRALVSMTTSLDTCIDALKNYPNVKNLTLPGFNHSLSLEALQRLQCFRCLEVLSLQNAILSVTGGHFLGAAWNLRKLSITDSIISRDALDAFGCFFNLRLLRLKKVKCEGEIGNLTSSLPDGLTHIDLRRCSRLFDGNMVPLLRLTELKTLKIDFESTEMEAMDSLKHLSAQLYLSILNVENPNDFRFLQRNHHIKSLTFIGHQASSFPHFVTGMKLESLSILNPVIVTNTQIDQLTSLTRLNLTLRASNKRILKSLERLGNIGLSILALTLPKIGRSFQMNCLCLEELSLEGIYFKGEALRNLVLIPSLCKLKIKGCGNLKRKHIGYLAALPSLKEIEFIRCIFDRCNEVVSRITND